MLPEGLQGPFTLSPEVVDRKVTSKLPGVYAVGHTDDNGDFVVETVGRSNENLQEPLLYLAAEFGGEFLFQYYPSAKNAFEKECELHHDCMTVSRATHPTRPDGSYWKCPRCHALN